MSEIITILHVFGRLDRGGAETLIIELFKTLDKSKFHFDFAVHGDKIGDYEKTVQLNGGNVYHLPKYKVYNHFKYVSAWKRLLSLNSFDVVHAHVRSTASIFLHIAKKYNIKTISHSHNTSSGHGIKAAYKNFLQKRIVKNTDFLMACSVDSAKWLFGKKIFNVRKVQILNNAIDTDKFTFSLVNRLRIRKELGINNEVVIGHVGRFHDQKNHTRIISIFSTYNKYNQNSKLILVGDGELKPKILNQVRALKLTDKVIFTGVRSDTNSLFSAFDILLFPSIHEGLPLVLVEAQTSGLPCIVSDVITTEINLTDLVKYVSLNKDDSEWVKVIENSLNIKRDIVYSNIMKNNGFDLASNIAILEKIYSDILEVKE